MNDYYLNNENCIERLLTEWIRYKKIVIAVDFGDTLYDFHMKGRTYNDVIGLIKKCQEIGCYLIVFTTNDDKEHHEFIKNYLSDAGIRVDSINENVDSVPFKTRKLYNILLDDRAGLSSYNILNKVSEFYIELSGNDI